MKEHPPDFWRRKARALLVPSPFSRASADHGKDESERIERVEKLLVSVNEDEHRRIACCARDAHVPGDEQARAQTAKTMKDAFMTWLVTEKDLVRLEDGDA